MTPDSRPPRTFIPALGTDWMTRFYDTVVRTTLPERRFKRRLIETARLTSGLRVLDLGCGTGTLLLMACSARASLNGVDPDLRILSYARRKAVRFGAYIGFHAASAADLPYRNDIFDRIFSTLAFHHLKHEEKKRAFAEAYRTLRSGGELHIGDFGAPDSFLSRMASFLPHKTGGPPVDDNYSGRLPSMAVDAGFADVEETGRFSTIVGVIRTFRARKQ